MDKTITILLTFICIVYVYGQNISIDNNDICLNLKLNSNSESFLIGLDNPLDIVYAQDEIIERKDIKVTFVHYNTQAERELEIIDRQGQLFIRPDSLGKVIISVKTKDGIKEKIVNTKPLTVIAKLSRYTANHYGKINRGEFSAQVGIYTSVEGYHVDAKCAILNYQIIRISNNDLVTKLMNQGGRFEKYSQELISNAESGDLFIFRNIMYKCPGNNLEQRTGDMIFEIK